MVKLITPSIVLYKTNSFELSKVVDSVLNTSQNLRLYLIDNSPIAELNLFEDYSCKIDYIHNPTNPGFEAAHNMAVKKAIESGSQYHFIVNPDIYFMVM